MNRELQGQLMEEIEHQKARAERAEAEVERLRMENEYHIETIDYLRPFEAEVERLRGTLAREQAINERLTEEFRKQGLEVERLRKNNDLVGQALLDENERLRGERDHFVEVAHDANVRRHSSAAQLDMLDRWGHR